MSTEADRQFDDYLDALMVEAPLSRAAVLKRADMLTEEEFAERAGLSRKEVAAFSRRGIILALYALGVGVRYPSWQLERDGSPRQDILEVIDFCDGDLWMAYTICMEEYPDGRGELVHEVMMAQTAASVMAHLIIERAKE